MKPKYLVTNADYTAAPNSAGISLNELWETLELNDAQAERLIRLDQSGPHFLDDFLEQCKLENRMGWGCPD